MTRWPNDGSCQCTNEELLDVGSKEDSEFYKRGGIVDRVTPEDWEGPYHNPKRSDIAMVRLVCAKVLKYRRHNNMYAEREVLTSVLGKPTNWGRRGQHVDAVSYLMRNVCPHFQWDGRKLSANYRRRLERELAIPILNYPEQREVAARNQAEAARRIARKASRER